VASGRIVGSVGLVDFGRGRGALRKMFVAKEWRGPEHRVAQHLLSMLLGHAKAGGLATILLGTTEWFLAAHRFYEKSGFRRVAPDALPEDFPRMASDTRFYRLDLDLR
jgi:N-acetylglutamate synthase-like GNAT family acetyltransferase